MRKTAICVCVVLTAAAAAVSACDKGDKKPPAIPFGGPAAKMGGSGAADPWAAPPAQASNVGADTGDGLAKLDLSGVKTPSAAIKVDVNTIPAAQVEALPVSGFAGVQASSGFRVSYSPSRDQVHENLRQVLADNKVFEGLTGALNKLIRVPQTVDVQVVDCGTVNAFYDPSKKRIIVCYELMTYFAQMFKPIAKNQDQLGMAVIGATTFAFFHEVGHGLIDILDIPAVGREEDSVDQLATLILIGDGDAGVGLALSGAHWFQLQQQSKTETPFYDEHAFDGQRFYNILCMIYGSNPQKYQQFVASGALPEARAQRCPEEYQKINKSWEKLLQPHLTNNAANNVDYQPTVNPAETNDPWAGPSSGGSEANEPSAPSAPSAPAPSRPAPRRPAGHAITCEQVAEKAVMLIFQEAQKRAASMSEDQIEQLKARLEAELPAMAEKLLSTCAKENWPDKDRKCVLDADSLEEATKCGIQ